MGTDELNNLYWKAEDSGVDATVYYSDHDETIIQYVIIDGEEFVNDRLSDELYDNDSYRFAERDWRE